MNCFHRLTGTLLKGGLSQASLATSAESILLDYLSANRKPRDRRSPWRGWAFSQKQSSLITRAVLSEAFFAHSAQSGIAGSPPTITTEGLQISKQGTIAKKLARIREYLDSGHTYQVNFTDRIYGGVDSEPLEIYQTLLRQQPVPFAAYLNRPSGAILSFSPELFYRVSNERSRPVR